jgi:hypothetical protein
MERFDSGGPLSRWFADHRALMLAVAAGYAIAVLALFGKQGFSATKAAIRPQFALRAGGYILIVTVLLVVATHFPTIAELFR